MILKFAIKTYCTNPIIAISTITLLWIFFVLKKSTGNIGLFWTTVWLHAANQISQIPTPDVF